MGLLQDAAQRAATLIRQVLGGGAPAAGAREKVTPFPANRTDGNGSRTTAQATAVPAAAAAAASSDSTRSLARKVVQDNRSLFIELFFDSASGNVRSTVQGEAIDRAFAAGKGGNLSPQSFRMAVVGCRIGSCPNDGVLLTKIGADILSEEIGRRNAAVH